ncbi:hypothetical protein ACPV5O_15820 [Vibrio maritimus]|uniref:hypothetical protein n=1 Tax=Vibrio maritimus TaxID=990268 RepID=UPI004067EEDE
MTTQLFGKNGWTPDRIRSLVGKTCVITGTNSGTRFVVLNLSPAESEAANDCLL